MEQREKVMLIVMAILAVGAGVYYIIMPRWEEYNNWEEEIETNVQKIREAQRRAAELEGLVEEVIKTKEDFKEARRRLPEGDDFLNLLSELERQARRAGIEDENILTFSRGNIETRGMVDVRSIEAQFQNITMASISDMLWRFDNLERLVDVRDISIAGTENEDGTRFNVSLILNVYILQEDTEDT
ncbi:MAG: type 4a pilus biogenesis protein PilO [bacterium]